MAFLGGLLEHAFSGRQPAVYVILNLGRERLVEALGKPGGAQPCLDRA